METATEILRQLGGRRFQTMTGARDLMSFEGLDEDRPWTGLSCKLPIGKVQFIRIALAPDDTYTIQFMSRTGRMIREIDGVYADGLRQAIEINTGLALSL